MPKNGVENSSHFVSGRTMYLKDEETFNASLEVLLVFPVQCALRWPNFLFKNLPHFLFWLLLINYEVENP